MKKFDKSVTIIMSRGLIFYAGQRAEKIVQKNFSQALRATAGENKNFRRFVKSVNYSCFLLRKAETETGRAVRCGCLMQ